MYRSMVAKKYVLVPMLCLMLLLAVTGCGGNTGGSSNQDVIKIGAILDLTGPGSSLGIPEKDSIEIWQKQINDKGGINGKKVEVIILDNKSDTAETVICFNKLVNNEKVCAVVGASQTSTSLAIVPKAAEFKIPLVSAAAGVKITEPVDERQWVFKTAQKDSIVAARLCEYLKSQNINKVAFLSVNTAYGQSGQAEFSAVAQAAGIQIVDNEQFGETDSTFTGQLTNVQNSGAQAMVVWAIPPSASLITKAARDSGITMPIFQSHGIANQKFIELATPAAAEGVIFPAGKLLVAESLPDSDPQKQVILNYLAAYEVDGRTRSAFGGHGYDAVMLVGKAIEKAGTDPAKIRDELEKMSMPGISGNFKINTGDHCGIGVDSLVMIKIVNGKWTLLQ